MLEKKKKAQMTAVLVILLIIAIGIFIFIYLLTPKVYKNNEKEKDNFCSNDLECVPASCCHATLCSTIKNKQDCSGIFCTASCEPGTLDCGQGSCKCINNKCKAVIE
ncbi:hypothetical protein HYW75_06985 [Candidatus Pacearchaeota archaeon]|nr:hypothetical protein [Candidatus Pacearchaeota archaeon]